MAPPICRYGSDQLRQTIFLLLYSPAGETVTVSFNVGPEELTYYSTAKQAYVQDSAEFDVWVGSDSEAELHGEFAVM